MKPTVPTAAKQTSETKKTTAVVPAAKELPPAPKAEEKKAVPAKAPEQPALMSLAEEYKTLEGQIKSGQLTATDAQTATEKLITKIDRLPQA